MQSWHERHYFADDLPIQRFEPPYDSLDPTAFETLAEYKKKLSPTLEPFLFIKGMEIAPPRPPNLPMPSTAPLTDGSTEQAIPTFPPRSASGAGSISRPDMGFGGNGFMAHPSSLANGSGTISRSTSSRQGSFDSFGSGSIQNPGVVPSPLNSSPALSSGMAQSYGAASSGFVNGLNQIGSMSGGTAHSTAASSVSAGWERQERDEFISLLREKELASGNMGPGFVRTNSVNSGITGPFGNGLAGSSIGVGQPIPRSPMFANTAATSPIGPYQQGISPAQSQAQLAYHSAFPRAPSYPQQPGSVPPTPYQRHPASINAWHQQPSGFLARQIAPPPPPSSIDIESPIEHQSKWGEPRLQDAYAQPLHQQEQIWSQQHQQQQELLPQRPMSQKRLPPLSLPGITQRYSTASARQSVQTLAKAVVEPPEEGSQQAVEPHSASQQPPESNTSFQLITDEQVHRLTSHFDDLQVQEPQVLPTPTTVPVAQEVVAADGSIAPPGAALVEVESSKPLVIRNTKVADASAEELPQPPAPVSSIVLSKSDDKAEAPEAANAITRKSNRKASASASTHKEATPLAPPVPTPAPASASLVNVPSPVTAPSKPAWSTLNNGFPANAASAGQSLREIQEAEAKRSGARKEKEKAMRVAALAARESPSPASDTESIPKTMTWGLSVSQASQTGRGGPAPASSAPAAVSTSVWSQTANGGPAKKSMKEILEEEERRKKAATAATHAQAQNAVHGSDVGLSLGKKAYIETARAGDAKVRGWHTRYIRQS